MPLMQKQLATLITIVCLIIPVISYAENTLITTTTSNSGWL